MKSNQELMDSDYVSAVLVDAGSNSKFDLSAMLQADRRQRHREIELQRRRELLAPVTDGDIPGSYGFLK